MPGVVWVNKSSIIEIFFLKSAMTGSYFKSNVEYVDLRHFLNTDLK